MRTHLLHSGYQEATVGIRLTACEAEKSVSSIFMPVYEAETCVACVSAAEQSKRLMFHRHTQLIELYKMR